MNSAKLLKSITKSNNALTLKLQKMSDANTAKTFKFNADEAAKQRVFNQSEATVARDWQKMMSDSSHQREVKDLKAAGLNPVLSANSGAQSYTTSAATSSAASGMADASSVGALAQLQGSQNSARASIYGSDASLKASQSMASAQRYAADRSYQAALASAAAARYSAEKHYEAQKYATDHQAVNSIGGFLSKHFGSELAGAVKSWFSGNKDSLKESASGLSSKSLSSVASNPDFKASDVLNQKGINDIRRALYRGGFKINNDNINTFAKLVFTHNTKLLYKMARAGEKRQNLSKYGPALTAVKYNWSQYNKHISW